MSTSDLDPERDSPELLFKDRSLLRPPDEGFVVCHVCKGYGGWNLKIDAYGPGRHFARSCGQCWGWGQVKIGSKDQTCKRHRFDKSTSLGRCYSIMTCSGCGLTKEVDSSD